MIDNIEQFLSDPSLKKLAPNTKKQTLNWLKSLRPSPSWRPSEGQMEALEYFVQRHKPEANAATGIWINYGNLVSLRHDLKTL